MSPAPLRGRSRSCSCPLGISAVVWLAVLACAVPATRDQRLVGSAAPLAGVGIAPSGAVSSGPGRVVDVTRVKWSASMLTTVVSH